MNPQNNDNCPRDDQPALQESRTARFDLPVSHPPRWRFLLDQLSLPALRLHRYRSLSTRIVEDTLKDMDRRHCQ